MTVRWSGPPATDVASGHAALPSTLPSTLACAGCGASPRAEDPYPFRCPNFGAGDVDHVLVRVLDPRVVAFPDRGEDAESEPFVRYRGLLHSYHRARAGGLTDREFVDVVRDLDARLDAVDGRRFACTPFARSVSLSDRLGFSGRGGVWVKDETRNVGGSHKARHLLGVLMHLEVSERLGMTDGERRPRLAIASCGNAALAAGVLACASRRRLRVFVPAVADGGIVERLIELDADVVVCPRGRGAPGDPTYIRLLEELDAGAVPFTVQGNLNGLAIEGGETLGYEIVSEALRVGLSIDHVVVQVGGGALASSCAQSMSDAVALGAWTEMPRFHTVQTTGAHPLERAYTRVRSALGGDFDPAGLERALRRAASQRSEYMWPWESEPKSIATGILDDETYDWLAVLRGMLSSGGTPVVAAEERLSAAANLGHEAGFDVSPTGAAGLAGLMDLLDRGVVAADERVAVLFTGSKG